MLKYLGGDRFKYPGTEVLINKADLRTQSELEAFEADVTALRLLELLDNPIKGNFDLSHYNSFTGIFSRTYMIGRANSAKSIFKKAAVN